MRVPVNPQTQYPGGQLGYEQAVDNTAGARALAGVVDKYAQYAEDEQKKRELFDVNKRIIDETNNIQQDFEDKTKVQPLGAPNFTQQVNGEYNTRHQQMVKQLQDAGYSEDAVNEFTTRLGTIRAQMVAKAIDFQEKSAHVKVLNDSNEMVRSLSQYVNTNPEGLDSAISEFQTSLQHSGLDTLEQAQIFDAGRQIIRKSALEGFTIKHPDVVLGLYSPTEPVTTSPPNLPSGQTFDLPSYLRRTKGAEGTGKNPTSTAVGYFQFTDRTWLDTYKEVFGKTGETDAQILAKKKDEGIATKLAEKLTNDNIDGLKAANKPINDATVYLAHFLGLSDAVKVLSAHADESVRGLISSKSIAANANVFSKGPKGHGANVQTAGDLLSWAIDKMGGEKPTPLKPIPPGWKGNVEDAIQELGMTADQAQEFLRTGKDTRTASQTLSGGIGPIIPSAEAAQKLGITFDAEGKTGIPALDQASGADRMQMLTLARTLMNEREADAKAAQRASHEQWLNEFLNGLQDGRLGQADLNTAYTNGQLTDYDERMKAQHILDEKNKTDKNLVLFQTMIQSGQQFNPFSTAAQDAAEAGFQHAVKYATENKLPTDAFTIALREWQRTGILPKSGGVMVRGALISTDPQAVLKGAAVAGNMLRQNPNAFAGVEGQTDIERAAVNFNHYVYDYGMSPNDAAARVAAENDPKFKDTLKYNDPVKIEAFKQLRQSGVNVAREVFPSSKFPNQDTLNEANQTYFSLIGDQLVRGMDLPTAMAQAKAQIQKVYGVNSNGRIVKYPPERGYPQVLGSWTYIYKDAQETVKAETGRDPIKINLVPIPGVTDQDFRTGKPPRYRIFYSHQAKDGQIFVDSVPGEFAADVSKATQEASAQDREDFDKARKDKIRIQQSTHSILTTRSIN